MRLVRTPTEIAERRRQHASSELGGLPIEFAALHALSTMHQREAFVEPLLPPTLDEVIDVIMAYKRGKALGTDAIAMELIQLGGLPAAALLHGLICACRQQCKTPLCWKGGRLVYLDKPGGVKFGCCDKRGILINDQISTIHGRLLRPQLLALAPMLVPSSQAIGPSRRGSILAAHCSWTLFAAAKQQGVSAGALYSDVKGAYYGVIRQLVVGSDQPDDTLRAVLQGLSLPIEVAQAMVEFIRLHGSLLQVAGAPLALVRLLREMNEETWFVMEGSPIVTATAKGARPGEATADLIFIFCLPALRRKSGRPSGCLNFQTMLPLASEGYLSASKGFDSSTDDLEAIYADDAMHGFLHESPEFVVAAIKFA